MDSVGALMALVEISTLMWIFWRESVASITLVKMASMILVEMTLDYCGGLVGLSSPV